MKFARSIRCLPAVAGILAAAATCPAQTNADRQLQLQVVDAVSRQPVPAVRVRAWVRGDLQTDAQGRCAFALPTPKSGAFFYRITLARPGYVPETITWSTAQQDAIDEMPTNYTAHLAKAVGIGGIVKTAQGEPIEGARVVFSGPPVGGVDREKTLVAPNYHSERTDADGRWTNSEVPADFQNMTFRVVEPGYISAAFGCAPSDEDTNLVVLSATDFLAGQALMTLGHGIVLSGRVLDPAANPVIAAVVTKDYEWRNPAATQETDSTGRFALPNLRAGEIVLTVQSPDWAPQTIPVSLSNGLPPLTINLQPGRALKGRVLDENGQPIAGARVQLDRAGRGPLEFDWSAETGDDGAFAWEHAPEGEHPYVIAAPGFHARSVSAWAAAGADKTVTLRHEKEGDGVEVEGVVTDAATGAPIPKYTLQLTEFHGGAVITSQQDVSAPNGHYRLLVDAGDAAFLLGVRADGCLPADGDRQSTGDGDQSADFALQRGLAREVTGRLIVNNYKDWIDWTNQEVSVVADLPKPPGLESEDPDTADRLMRDFLQTPAGRKWRRAQTAQPVAIDARGFFKIRGVAPGAHELRAQVAASPAQGGGLIATLNRKFDVPEATANANPPIDLGTVEISARHDLDNGDAAPDFAVKNLDGAALKLADFRGKFVLLDFWATWCGPCVAEMPNLKAAYDAFAKDGRVVMISLSLDRDLASPKAFVRKNGLQWRQGFLGDWSQTEVPNQYGVEGIPAIFLIGPDGKILEHNLRGPAIGEALKKALNTPN